eukprot:CAMPEP_0119012442 /NCGR_PEP_ID=MMETSP1176-20130426/6731_1 /TAXON_ID=265551 /ORGANISM="Synedropsis recta cf, Strain CCMP1620" /LENGTH=168 /DNA_ID=CAMNT_0006965401 /DNA_START=41 /DNA_END=547 /DNA_ORIENTATION=+
MPPLNQTGYSSDDSAHSTVSVDSATKTTKVGFSSIEIREYERVVGDHPDTKVGPPMSLGWAFVELDPLSIDDYEATHKKKGTRRMSSITRKNILKNVFEIPEEEIRNAEKEVQKILKNRVKTNTQGKVSETTEVVVQSFGRKLKRTFSKDRLWKGFVESQRMFPTAVY